MRILFFTSYNFNIRGSHVLKKTKHSLAGQWRREHDVNIRHKQETMQNERCPTPAPYAPAGFRKYRKSRFDFFMKNTLM